MKTPPPPAAPVPRAPRQATPDRIDRALQQAVAQRVFPAACLLVAVDGQPVVHRAFGRARLDSVFDLASLTKPFATATTVMRLVAAGLLTLETRVGVLIPALRGAPLGAVTLAQLLGHASGLPEWLPLYQQVAALPARRARQRARELIAATPLLCAPGRRTCYSDLGYLVLDWALEAAAGERLDRLAQRLVYTPLGLGRTGFVDLADRPGAARLAQQWPFVPTERCPRRGRLCGAVHDDNAHAIGGVAGHAGLFSTAFELHLIVRQLVAAARGRPALFDGDVVRRCFETQPVAGSSWRLGWDTPGGERPSAGRAFGPHSVGHLGFTGTSVWIDRDRPWWMILLTNRVYDGREPNRIKPLRPRLHETVQRALAGWGYL